MPALRAALGSSLEQMRHVFSAPSKCPGGRPALACSPDCRVKPGRAERSSPKVAMTRFEDPLRPLRASISAYRRIQAQTGVGRRPLMPELCKGKWRRASSRPEATKGDQRRKTGTAVNGAIISWYELAAEAR